jgi:hypothetical protein
MTSTQPSAQSQAFVNSATSPLTASAPKAADCTPHAHLVPSEEDRGSGRFQLMKSLPAPRQQHSQVKQPTDHSSLRLIAIGSRQTLINNMKMLHLLRYADMGDWSKLQRGPNPGEFMSVLTLRSPHIWTS